MSRFRMAKFLVPKFIMLTFVTPNGIAVGSGDASPRAEPTGDVDVSHAEVRLSEHAVVGSGEVSPRAELTTNVDVSQGEMFS